jgi:D-alanine-D-alanine ligase
MSNTKKKIAVIFGGKSGEHEVSISSAISVFNALDKSKYEVTLIGIDKSGRWLLPSETLILTHAENPRLLNLNKEKETISLVPYESQCQLISIETKTTPTATSTSGSLSVSSKFDVILPILHGPHGEDGTVQGLLELSNIPYVGSGVLGSALGMDKDVSRRLLAAAGIPVVPTLVFKKHEFVKNKQQIIDQTIQKFGFPFFVKPANMGSSVGVNKVKTKEEALAKFENAFAYDNKILAEKAIDARELECSVLGNSSPQASIVGEIIPQHEFYSYEAKYIDENGALLEIPAKNISSTTKEEVRKLSIDAFKVLECSGLARVDFFLDRQSGQLYLNEINTLPGFTKISMYPKLWEASGKPYSQLLDELIEFALEKHSEKNGLRSSFEPDEI